MKTGIVIKSTGKRFKVKTRSDDIIDCNIKGTFRIKGIRATNPVTVGDVVDYIINPDKKSGLIINIHPRKNYIIRRSSNLSKEYQLLASNIDIAWLVVSLISPKTLTEFTDRMLVTAEAYRIPARLIFNKTDLYDDELNQFMFEQIRIYTDIGYKCYSISAKDKINLDILKKEFKNRNNVLIGNSGVGKSTILNAIAPELNIKTKEISDYHKQGKHTTTFPEMHELNDGGYVIDTPGIRAFGVVDMEKNEIYHFFPEIFKISSNCQFSNCLHMHEPGCAVKKAVDEGIIQNSRYLSYISLMKDDYEKYR